MSELKISRYGSWKSPLTSDLIVADSTGLSGANFAGENIMWLELRPKENGRLVVILRTPDGEVVDLTTPPFNVRTRVHEYGGGACLMVNSTLFFSNFIDQRLYRLDPGNPPRPITPEMAYLYADYIFDTQRNLLFSVREDHTGDGEAINTLVKLHPEGDEQGGEVILSGNNFYSSPRLSPDGSTLTWLTWNHPNMPWDGTELWVGKLDSRGFVQQAKRIAGGVEESIFQPEWSPDGVLYFISDRSGWWNLYRWQNGKIHPLAPRAAEFGQPQWSFGMSTYAFHTSDELICSYLQDGDTHLARLNTQTLQLQEIQIPFTYLGNIRVLGGKVLFTAGSPESVPGIFLLDLTTGQIDLLRKSSRVTIDPGYLSIPQAIEFDTENQQKAYGFFYPPANKDYQAPDGEKPPLLVLSHGGPTSATSSVFNASIQYWTSRGFAVLDVNYGGSSGYGRAYRQRLNGNWGVVDVDDCVNGALYLVKHGLVDENRLIIRGGSAGGYTTLCALTFRRVFKAGASHFGIGDLEPFVYETHKFESRYLDSLIGPYPERADLYRQRSAIHYTDQLSCPMILFQGAEDKVVPPDQSRKMYEAVKAKGLPVAYLEFEGEQHGFRKAENIKRALDAELYFYAKVFNFPLADPVEPVQIDNL